jgi:CRP-like cAMP-binding protein
MVQPPDYQDNLLLNALSPQSRQRIYPNLKLVEMTSGSTVYESGSVLDNIYFPTNSIISKLYVMGDGSSAEIAMIGNEGAVGIALFMGGMSTPSRAIVQCAGHAYRLSRAHLMAEFDLHSEFHHLLLRYTQTLITQMAQTAACNRYHSIDQQLCRWLLLSRDRRKCDSLDITHEMISQLLGVRRESVSAAANKLQDCGAIEYRRGHLTILDRQGLLCRCCECYTAVTKEYDRLLGARAHQSN